MLKLGDVFLDRLIYRGNPARYLFALLVKQLTNSNFVHASFYLGEIEDHFIIGEALAKGLTLTKAPKTKIETQIRDREKTVLRHKVSNPQDRKKLVTAILYLEGRSYGFIDLFKAVAYITTGYVLFGETVRQLTCSESIARAYELASLGFKDQDLDLVFPKDILESEDFEVISPSEILP